MKRESSLSMAFWLPSVFAAVLCAIALFGREAAAPTFYSLLPIAFMLVALALGRLHGELRQLEEKVRVLTGEQVDRPTVQAA